MTLKTLNICNATTNTSDQKRLNGLCNDNFKQLRIIPRLTALDSHLIVRYINTMFLNIYLNKQVIRASKLYLSLYLSIPTDTNKIIRL